MTTRGKRSRAKKDQATGRYQLEPGAAPRLREPSPVYSAGPDPVRISATDAARGFSDLVSRAAFQGETFLIERGGKAVCQLGPLPAASCTGAELLELLSRLPPPDEGFLEAVEEAIRDQDVLGDSPWDT